MGMFVCIRMVRRYLYTAAKASRDRLSGAILLFSIYFVGLSSVTG